MWAQYTPLQKLGFYSIGGMLLFVTGYIGRQHLSSRPELVLTPANQNHEQLQTPTDQIYVHVVGAVTKPGVVHLADGARLEEALAKAGGPTKDADLERINLAAKAEDGIQLRIPRKGEKITASAPIQPITRSKPRPPKEITFGGSTPTPDIGPLMISPRQTGTSSRRSEPTALSGGTININSATAEQLDALPGVGPATAAKIIQYRDEHGGFSTVDELMEVKGIGPKKLEAMRKFVSL